MQKSIASVLSTWNRAVQPHLARDPRLPAKFILDVANALVDNVIAPVDSLQNQVDTTALIISGSGLGVPGLQQLAVNASDEIKSRTAAAASTIDFIFRQVLTPLANEAKAAINGGGARAMVRVVTSGTDRLDQVIAVTLQAGITAITQIAALRDQLSEHLLFRIADFCRRGAEAVAAAFVAIGGAIAAGAASLYGLIKTLITLAKVAVVGGVGYLGYKLYRDNRRPALAAPAANPARRRRRRSSKHGRRARYYLR
ncbi:MAG TPA: hypothetical protein VFD36_29280 [Kofleriaceae bacterium]|nr:hypothetical protein [Kofleriaceae bacterium]